jgi:tetratricopeptide (TPR) repeat protein
MIVKNEAHVIERCLRSVLPFIDAWLIVDTGSTDDTRQKIEHFFAAAGKPGQVVVRPWVDFGTNRTQALELCRPLADYSLVIDADEVLEVEDGFRWPALEEDAYQILHRQKASDTAFYLTQLVRSSLPFRYVGVLHEVIVCDRPHRTSRIQGAAIRGLFDSARNQGDPQGKYARDAEILERALKSEPENARYAFYLAQSYRDAGKPELAVEAYQRRARMAGFEEEGWYSELMRARLLERLGQKEAAIVAYLRAYERRPSRAEPLCDLARLHRESKSYHLAHLFASAAVGLKLPGDILFVEEGAYTWRGQDELAVSAYYVGRYEESRAACAELLEGEKLPAGERARVQGNLEFAKSGLKRVAAGP